MNKIINILIILTLVITVIVGINTRLSYTDHTADKKFMENCKTTYLGNDPFNRNSTKVINSIGSEKFDFETMCKKADVILKVQKLSSSQKHYSTLSKVKVVNIFKGKEIVSKDDINVYEPYFYLFTAKTLVNINGYVPMNENKEYFLFLNKRYLDTEYRGVEDRNTFVLATRDTLSKYPLGGQIKNYNYTDYTELEEQYSLSQIEDYDLVSNDTGLKDYTDFYKSVLDKYGNK